MKRATIDQKRLISEFLSNIGVAWFTAGVIGAFFNKSLNFVEIISSVGWGIGLGFLSLSFALVIIKWKPKKRRKKK